MSIEYRALTGISYRDASGAEVSLDRGDPVPPAVIEAHPWLLEDASGRGPAAELLTAEFTVSSPGPVADSKED